MFGHDTADGSYTGWSSWSEKPFNRLIWGRIERARAIARANAIDAGSPGFNERVMLLSTTHFGLSSPVLNIDRERRAFELSEEMLRKELEAQSLTEQITLVNSNGGNIVSAELCFAPGWLSDIGRLNITAGERLQRFGGVALGHHEDGSVAAAFVLLHFDCEVHSCDITVTNDAKPGNYAADSTLLAGDLAIKTCEHGEILSVSYKGQRIGGKDFLRSFLSYDNRNYPMTAKRRRALPVAGALQGLRIEGELHLPGELLPGQCQYDFFTLPGLEGIMLRAHVQYPYTREDYAVSSATNALERFYDVHWQQAAPMQLTPKLPGELHVVKRNFAHEISDFPVASFRESVPENENLDSFNHQLTGGFVGLSNGETGLLLANARQISGSMAHCPMRLRRTNGQDIVQLNPFGTYNGRQRKHPSRGNGSICEAFVIVAPQSRSLAPAYNGVEETALVGLFGYEGLRPQGELLAQVCAVADGAVLQTPAGSPVRSRAAAEDYVRFPKTKEARGGQGKRRSVLMSGAQSGPLSIAKTGLRAFGHIVKTQRKVK